jgi:hypothetical protein
VIDFIDGDPAPACGAEAFFRADRNQDGQLDLDEYLGGYPFATCDEPVVRPMPVDRLPVPTTIGSTASGTPKGYGLACMAPIPPDMHPGVAEFQARDLSQDGLLSLDEFLGQVAPPPPPVDPCEEAFHALDADADGRLLFQEWMMGRPVPMIGAPEGFPRRLPPFDAVMRREFRSLDLNGDGALDLAEHCGWVAVPMPATGSQPRTK